MGCLMSAIRDDYDEYVELCKSLHVSPLSIYEEFYEHEKEVKMSMRVYTKERVNSMSAHERAAAIEAVKTSNSLSIQEKKANLLLLEPDHSKDARIIKEMMEGMADLDDMGGGY